MLLRHYGGVPLIGDNVYDVDDKMKTSRDTYADCVKYIVEECELAAKDLPDVFSGPENGRATAGACKGLVSRIRLYEASALHDLHLLQKHVSQSHRPRDKKGMGM